VVIARETRASDATLEARVRALQDENRRLRAALRLAEEAIAADSVYWSQHSATYESVLKQRLSLRK
jgi:hypothetical protein